MVFPSRIQGMMHTAAAAVATVSFVCNSLGGRKQQTRGWFLGRRVVAAEDVCCTGQGQTTRSTAGVEGWSHRRQCS